MHTALAVSDVFLVKSAVTAVGKLAGVGIGKLAASEGTNFLYHYTTEASANAISEEGLKIGKSGYSYLTNTGKLTTIQAQIDLAIPSANGLPSSLLKIDVSGLSPTLIRKVTGNLPGLSAGGGTEYLFDQFIEASRITKIR